MGETLAAVTAGTMATSAAYQYEAAKTQAHAESRAARYNAALERMTAEAAASRVRRIGEFEAGQAFANLGTSGVLAEGSPIRAILANAREREKEAVDIEINGARSAALEEARAKNAIIIGRQRGSAAILSGLTAIGTFGTSLLLKK